MKKLLVLPLITFFVACSSTNPDFYIHNDIKNHKSFSKSGKTQALFRCEESKNKECLLFDKDGNYIGVRQNPSNCFRVQGDKYCPTEKIDDFEEVVILSKDEKLEKQTQKEESIKQTIKEVNEDEPLKVKKISWFSDDKSPKQDEKIEEKHVKTGKFADKFYSWFSKDKE